MLEGVSTSQMEWLLQHILEKSDKEQQRAPSARRAKLQSEVRSVITRLVPSLCLGSREASDVLVRAFARLTQWTQIDEQR